MTLTLVRPVPRSVAGKPRALYRCSCGAEVVLQVGNVRSGNTRSCGCLRRATHTTHGQAQTPLYKVWENMRQRTSGSPRYPTYAGVRCDPRWDTFLGFVLHPPLGHNPFGADHDFYEPGLCLTRAGDSGDYTPENTRWLTRSENAREQAGK